MFPTLYRGNRYWQIRIEKNKIIKESGVVNTHKPMIIEREIYGKNKGKKNETSDDEQASLQAQRDFLSQKKKGYKTREEYDPEIKDIFPVACHKWEDKPSVMKHFSFSKTIIQPKFDGVRCVAYIDRNLETVRLVSRGKKEWKNMKNLKKHIYEYMKDNNLDIIDGELYKHRFKNTTIEDRFNLISEICNINRIKPHSLEDEIEFHVFDIISFDIKLIERINILSNTRDNQKVKIVESRILPEQKIKDVDLEKIIDEYTNQGYEGIIIKAGNMLYQKNMYDKEVRCLQIRKYKKFLDDECIIVGAHLDKGVSDEHFVWECKFFANGSKFNAVPIGTVDKRKREWKSREEFYGKKATVKYQELTRELKNGGVPRFGKIVGLRYDI